MCFIDAHVKTEFLIEVAFWCGPLCYTAQDFQTVQPADREAKAVLAATVAAAMTLENRGCRLATFILLILCIVATEVGASRIGAHLINTASTATTPWRLTSWSDVMRKKKVTECDDTEFRQHLLAYIKEMPFAGLFEDTRGTTKFEASGMTIAQGWLWVVFDNLHALGRVNQQFEFRDPRNVLVGELGADSQFEGLTFSEKTGHFYAVEEVYDSEEHGLHPFVHELKISEDGHSYSTVARCPFHFLLTHGNKGFEGLHLHEHDGHTFMLGLCEGNFCVGGSQGREPGNGRIVVAAYNDKPGDACGWDVVKTVEIPSTAYFMDYSGMAFRGNKAAIISQEDSAMWLGSFDFEAMEFTSDGQVFNFPRDHHCDVTYCNVEGVQWIDDVRFAIASDKAKSNQPFKCVDKEQRVSIFSLPYAYGAEA